MMEPYSLYSRNSGFSKGIEVYLIRELVEWSNFDVELRPIDKINGIQQAQFQEKYVSYRMPEVAL